MLVLIKWNNTIILWMHILLHALVWCFMLAHIPIYNGIFLKWTYRQTSLDAWASAGKLSSYHDQLKMKIYEIRWQRIASQLPCTYMNIR